MQLVIKDKGEMNDDRRAKGWRQNLSVDRSLNGFDCDVNEVKHHHNNNLCKVIMYTSPCAKSSWRVRDPSKKRGEVASNKSCRMLLDFI